jgi:hypothetical protein
MSKRFIFDYWYLGVMALGRLSNLLIFVFIILVLNSATVIAESQLELRSGDILYSSVLDSSENYNYSGIECILYKI